MTDFRTLCADLHAAVQLYTGQNPAALDMSASEVVSQLMAALAATAEALTQPQLQGPSDEELKNLANKAWISVDVLKEYDLIENAFDCCGFARAVLARWGRPAIEPVLVSERLPGPEDCAPWPDDPDANPWAWAGKKVYGGWEWVQLSMQGLGSDALRIIAGGGWTHWLPHHALPVPQQEVE